EFPVAGRPADAAIDDQFLRLLRDVRIEVVAQHAVGRLDLPVAAAELGTMRALDDTGIVATWIGHDGPQRNWRFDVPSARCEKRVAKRKAWPGCSRVAAETITLPDQVRRRRRRQGSPSAIFSRRRARASGMAASTICSTSVAGAARIRNSFGVTVVKSASR